ncbi:MAG: helix-turn-helix domain-containing protein [Chlamydiia bacterium]
MDALSHCGEFLRTYREQRGLTLRDVEKATSIRLAYLQAIETGQIEGSISPIYVNGFMRQYAQFLGLDMETLAGQFPQIFQICPIRAEFVYGIGTLEMRGAPNGGVRVIPNWLIVAGVFGVAVVCYLIGNWMEWF